MVIGRPTDQPLSDEELKAIEAAAKDLSRLDPQAEVGFDQQPVLDLLAELKGDRHR
jgi:hypothetical protein